MSDNVRFSFNVVEGSLELEGSEEFVTKTLQEMKPFLSEVAEAKKVATNGDASRQPAHQAQHDTPPPAQQMDGNNGNTPSTAPTQGGTGLEVFPHTFSELEGNLHIVAQIPGDSTKQKMKNVGLLCCLGLELLGENTVQSESIRNACLEHGCLDSGNFMKSLKDKQTFITVGDRKKTVRLTHAGRMAAKQLAESIEENANN